MPHNIEASGFRPGQYVGYGAGGVWNISATGIARGDRKYWCQIAPHSRSNNGLVGFYAATLAEAGRKLEAE